MVLCPHLQSVFQKEFYPGIKQVFCAKLEDTKIAPFCTLNVINMSDILLIFTKNPILGHVKTRLARTMGDVAALNIYQVLLDRTRLAAAAANCTRQVWYADFIPKTDAWQPPLFSRHLQQGEDLGERMAHAFQSAFAAGAEKAVIIGCDCYAISPAIIQNAFDALNTFDFSIGPSNDGGYYLLGMKQPQLSVFSDMVWSTDTVLKETLEKIDAAGGRYFLLPTLTDIDTEEDWRSCTAPS